MDTLKIELNKFYNIFDSLEDEVGLTLFQIAFLKEVKYHTLYNGEFNLYKKHFYNKYKEILDSDGIENEIAELVGLGYVTKELKRTIYNGRFVTNTKYRLVDSVYSLNI